LSTGIKIADVYFRNEHTYMRDEDTEYLAIHMVEQITPRKGDKLAYIAITTYWVQLQQKSEAS